MSCLVLALFPGLAPADDPRQRSRVFLDCFGNSAAANKLPSAVGLDQAGIREDLQVVRDGGGRNSPHGHDFAAVDLLSSGDGLENHQSCLVGKGFRDFLN